MFHPNFIILYVDNPSASAAFYSQLLGKNPAEVSENFVLFALENGIMLGLWSQQAVQPAPTLLGNGGELAFSVENNETLETLYADWVQHETTILQNPTHMDFGYTFVALDPDGNRLRVFAPTAS